MKEIELSKNGTKYKGKICFVDDDVYDIVNQYNWSYHSGGYAKRGIRINGKDVVILMHNYIWELKMGQIPTGYIVDHKNGDRTLNTIKNLRLATYSQNACNTKKQVGKSGYKNISDNHSRKKILKDGTVSVYPCWKISITYEGRTYSKEFYYHNDEEKEQKLQDAIKWQEYKEKELHQEYALSNRPKDKK